MTDAVAATTIRPLELNDSLNGRPFLSAASGLAAVGDTLVVVADDSHHIAWFPPGQPGSLVRILPGELPGDPADRKRHKPDFEAIAPLPRAHDHAPHDLLLIGSGSTARRERIALVRFDDDGRLAGPAETWSASALYAAVRAACGGEINIEAAFTTGDDVILISRAHGGRPVNHVVRVALQSIRTPNGSVAASPQVLSLVIGSIADVPLGITDAAALSDGRWMFSAVAEDTSDSYNDGALVGAVLGLVDAAGTVTRCSVVTPTLKIEGIVATETADAIDVTMVTDADDPDVPALLLHGRLNERPFEGHPRPAICKPGPDVT